MFFVGVRKLQNEGLSRGLHTKRSTKFLSSRSNSTEGVNWAYIRLSLNYNNCHRPHQQTLPYPTLHILNSHKKSPFSQIIIALVSLVGPSK